MRGAERPALPPSAPIEDVNWPSIEGIDAIEVRARLSDDRALFENLLARFVESAAAPPILSPDADAAELESYRARVHRLRGSAGQLGAKGIFELGARIEAHCRVGERERAAELSGSFERALLELCTAIRTRSRSPDPDDPPCAVTSPLGESDPETLDRLMALLAEQDLSALDAAGRMGPQLKTKLGDEAFQRLRQHLDRLEFSEAGSLLSSASARDSPAGVTNA